MTIRNAGIDDLQAIAEIESACFPAAEAASKESLHARLSAYPNHFWLLQDGTTPIGFINGMATDEPDLRDEMYQNAQLHDETGKWQMIFGLDILPDCRRHGYAERLIRQVISEAKAQRRSGIVLTCKEALLPYYAKFGFLNEGISSSEHGNAVWYQMRLTF